MASMAMRPSRGFLVGDGALRKKNDKNKAAKRQTKIMQKKNKKPEWDDTVTDLNVYKASQDELRRRHEAHKSKNTGWAREIQTKENQCDTNPADSTPKQKQAILHEILFGQDKFQTVLAETDTTMSAVKDLFGDDPKKYFGFPNITSAPKSENNSQSRYMSVPVSEMLDSATQLSILSDSIMRTPALNEVCDRTDTESSASDDEQEDAGKDKPQRTIFDPQLDLQHYRQLISYESNKGVYKMEDVVRDGHTQNQMLHSYPEVDNKELQGQSVDVSQTSSDWVPSIVKDTSNVQNAARSDLVQHKSIGVPSVSDQVPSNERKIQSKVAINPIREGKTESKRQPKANDTSTSSSSSSLRSLEDLKKMVESLEDEIAEYEMETGRQPTTTTPQSRNFSGYTSSLIMAVTKLVKYLKETEMQRNAEAILRDQILQGFSEQRELIDALTNDIVQTQEQNMKLQSELHYYRQNTDNQLNYLKRELEFVLKSFEYQTVQSTIKTLHSTKPVSLDTSSQSHEHPVGDIHTAQGSHRKLGAVQECLRTQGAFIPVSAPREAFLNDKQLNYREPKDVHFQVTRKQRGCDDPEEASSAIPKTIHTYSHVTPSATHGTVQSHDDFQPKQFVMPAPIIKKRQQTNTSRSNDITAVSTQDQGMVMSLQTHLNTQHRYPPGEATQQEARSNGRHGFSTVNQYTNEDLLLVKSLIKDPLATKDLRNRLQGIALKQRTTVAMRTGTTADRKTIQDENLPHPPPSVHFKLPQDKITNKSSINQRTVSSLPEKSPCITPIPHEDPPADVHKVQMTGLGKEKHVVINLPSVWSDFSSSAISI